MIVYNKITNSKHHPENVQKASDFIKEWYDSVSPISVDKFLLCVGVTDALPEELKELEALLTQAFKNQD